MTTSPSQAAEAAVPVPWFLPAASALHLGALGAAGTLGWDFLLLDGLLVALAFAPGSTRLFAAAVFPLWLTGVLYLNVQPLVLPLRGAVHTGDLWTLDAALFPAPGALPWPAWFDANAHAALDLFAGAAYLVYLFEFFAVFAWFFLRRRTEARKLAWAFLAVNVLGIAGYVLFPAAPPWYVIAYGHGPADLGAAASAAGAARFDELLGIGYFDAFYAKSPNVFGAMPSLHAAYPAVAAFFLWRQGPALRWGGIAFAAWVAFAAVYLAHHYVLDVLAGTLAGLLAAFAVEAIARRAARPGTARPGAPS